MQYCCTVAPRFKVAFCALADWGSSFVLMESNWVLYDIVRRFHMVQDWPWSLWLDGDCGLSVWLITLTPWALELKLCDGAAQFDQIDCSNKTFWRLVTCWSRCSCWQDTVWMCKEINASIEWCDAQLLRDSATGFSVNGRLLVGSNIAAVFFGSKMRSAIVPWR